jgi:hypothetical protein
MATGAPLLDDLQVVVLATVSYQELQVSTELSSIDFFHNF